jgi:hypothetical protein
MAMECIGNVYWYNLPNEGMAFMQKLSLAFHTALYVATFGNPFSRAQKWGVL